MSGTDGSEEEVRGSGRIQVCVRVRPLIRRERDHHENSVWTCDGNSIQDVNGDKSFHFDHLFSQEHTTDDIYRDVIAEIVANAMLGYHGSVFSYGQTASGSIMRFK